MPFLTDLDERAEVKGSRDPLGLVPLWSKFGREVIGNLTTVTDSVRGFTTVVVGFELAGMLREQFRNDAPATLDTFLRFEQIAGYARVKRHARSEVRGYRRVSRRLNEGQRIRISTDPSYQILSNQKIYGLWGLFTVPARSSGLIVPGEQRLTADAANFVERQYFPMLAAVGGVDKLLNLLRHDSFELHPNDRHFTLLNAVALMHSPRLRAEERVFYREHLAWGGKSDSTAGRQRALAEILAGIDTHEFGLAEFRDVQKKARKKEFLYDSLEKIAILERLIAPAALLFGFIQGRHGQTLSSVARQIAETWKRPLRLDLHGLRSLQPTIGAALHSQDEAELWMELAQTLSDGKYGRVIELLVAINGSVMLRRHGAAAWVATEDGKIRVRYADERTHLMSVEDAENLWRSTYFINSLWVRQFSPKFSPVARC